MRKKMLLPFLCGLLLFGCARTWDYALLEDLQLSGPVPLAASCQECHEIEHQAWQKNQHSDMERMAIISRPELRECGACHDDAAKHLQDPEAYAPKKINSLSKTEQNNICGKCHYNQAIFGAWAINPHDKHSLLMGVGLEGQKRQLSCLDCHSGHQGKSEMLIRAKAHICFKCHGEAVITMGIFQPLNYLTFGKTCQACHAVHGGSETAQWARMGVGFCVVCHFTGVALAN